MTISSGLKSTARRLLGARAGHALGQVYRRAQEAADPRYRASRRRLAALHDRHRGRRCFIIGNGPSLNNTDLTRLKDEYTFGLNRIYMMFEKLGFATTYLVAMNYLVIEQCAADIAAVPCPKFIAGRSRNAIEFTDDMMFLAPRQRPQFHDDITRGVWEGGTVTFVAMQVAYYLGFTEVILIGVDHSFATRGEPNKLVVSGGDDPNHFDAQYFGKGFRWQLPDLERSEIAYRLARAHFEDNGRRILDATVGGKLQIFPKVDYDTLFG